MGAKTYGQVWIELGEALRGVGRALLGTRPGRSLVATVEWLARKLDPQPGPVRL